MNLNNYSIINKDGKTIIELDLNYFIECVEENNYINNGRWSQWKDADEILNVYLDYINNVDIFDGYIIFDINSVKKELNKKINEDKEKEFKPFSKLKLHSYHKVKYCKKDINIDLGSEIRTYFNFSAYEVIREMYNKYLITTYDINDYNIDVFLIKNDLIIRKIRQEYNLNEVDMACIRQILENTFEN